MAIFPCGYVASSPIAFIQYLHHSPAESSLSDINGAFRATGTGGKLYGSASILDTQATGLKC